MNLKNQSRPTPVRSLTLSSEACFCYLNITVFKHETPHQYRAAASEFSHNTILFSPLLKQSCCKSSPLTEKTVGIDSDFYKDSFNAKNPSDV
jgi:hypothetical protein